MFSIVHFILCPHMLMRGCRVVARLERPACALHMYRMCTAHAQHSRGTVCAMCCCCCVHLVEVQRPPLSFSCCGVAVGLDPKPQPRPRRAWSVAGVADSSWVKSYNMQVAKGAYGVLLHGFVATKGL